MTDMSREVPAVRGIALLGEVLLVGVLVCLAALPVVTVLAAAGAGAVLVRELVTEQRTPTVRRFAVLLLGALRQPVVTAAPVLWFAVAGLDLIALRAGLPGGHQLGPVLLAVLAGGVLAGLRGAARWRPDHAWRLALAEGAELVVRDWSGSLLLAGALVGLGVVADQVPSFLLILPGLLVMAAVAVERRATR